MNWVRKAVEDSKQCLQVHTSKSLEDSDNECDLINCGGPTQEVEEEKNINMCSFDILSKNVAASCHCLKSLVKVILRVWLNSCGGRFPDILVLTVLLGY